MENDTSNADTENGAENVEETTHENSNENAQENQVENLTLEGMTKEVSEIYAGFDPQKHAVNPDGTPKKRADGQWASKRGRKPGQTPSSAPVAASAPTSSAPLSAKKAREAGVITNEAAARQTVALVVTALGSTLGDEWNFATQEEADNMRAAVKAYYDANGQVAISPELMLTFQVAAYAAPRAQHPNTKAKLKTAWEWCKNLFGKIGG
jgi:hypothetical protein